MIHDIKSLALVDASSLIREPLEDIRRRTGGRDLAIPPIFFDDLLHQSRHPSLGTRAQRVARVQSRIRAYSRRVAVLDWLDFSASELTTSIKFFELASPEECEAAFAQAEETSKPGDTLAVKFFTQNAERFAPEIHELPSENLALIREWACNGREQTFVSRLAAEWSAKVFDLDTSIPVSDRVRLAKTGTYCRMTMLVTLFAIQEIGLTGNNRTSKPERLVARWNDLVYAIYGSLCGTLVTHDNELRRIYEALREVPRFITARSFE
ncbi:MAG: hypothetical protein KF754_07950 [Planctomycetes bacterium]|nr:hypothetical protein [Planctomycetota bacterium]